MVGEAGVHALLMLPPPSATGRLDGAVNLSRQDGMLELTKLSYDLSGDYSCGVELSSGEKKESEPWEVLIVGESCRLRFSATFTIIHTFCTLLSY